MVVRCKLKIPSLRISVRHHEAQPNSYPNDGIFNPHPTTLKDSYIYFFFFFFLSWEYCAIWLVGSKSIPFEPPHDKTNKRACAPSGDLDQPGHPLSLIRDFAVRMKTDWVLSYPLRAQWRLWSDWADAQADLSLCWAHMPFSAQLSRRLISWAYMLGGPPSSVVIVVHTL